MELISGITCLWKRSFNNQTVKVSICRIYFYPFEYRGKYASLHDTNSNTVLLEFENDINHRCHLKTFGNKRVIYFNALHLDGISGITCLQM